MASISTLVDRVKIVVLSSGTGSFQLGPPVPAYRGLEALVDGATYSYATENGSQFEVGTGVYIAGSSLLVRTPLLSSNGGAAISFPSNIQLLFTALAQDLTAIGAVFPIIDALGNDPDVAASQRAVTNGINSKYDASNPSGFVDAAGVLSTAVGTAGTQAPARDSLAAPAGSSIVGFRQAGSNPLTRTLQDEIRRTIDASQFIGFDPTGVTDSTAAVQNALNLAASLGGAEVTISGGRVLLLSSASLTIPAQCSLVGPYSAGGVDNGGTNLSYPWGTMGGTLVLDSGPGRVILCKGSINGFLIHRKGMTFPSTSAGSDYTGEAVHLAGDGANAQNCMILGFKRGVYARLWQRIFVYNVKLDCTAVAGDSCIDIRQAGDTSLVYKCDAWPYAGGGSNTLNTRAGAFITLKGRNDWTQIVQCQEYGYQYGYDLQNEADDSAVVFGPANVRIIQCRSDDGWGGSGGSHAGKIGIRLGTASATVKAFDVLIEGFQGSCNTVAGIYSNLETGMTLRVSNSFTWNGAQYGLAYQKGGNLTVTGGGNRGDGPGVSTPYGQYSLAYDVAGGSGRTLVGGGFDSRGVTNSHIRVAVQTDSFNVDWRSFTYDTGAPVFDNAASTIPTVASAADISLPLRRPESLVYLTGNATITTLGPARTGERRAFICTDASGPTFTNNSNMRVNGNANFTVTVAGTYVEFIGMANGTTTQWRMTASPST